MLNTTSPMAFSDHLSYMTPTRSSARGVRRPLTMLTGRDCAGDYFASSVDFETDLFLHGLVSCDSALPPTYSRGAASASTSNTSSASSSFSASGFFSRYRASRPVSSNTASSSATSSRQERSNQSLLTALSITSLNRSSTYEQPYNSYYQASDDSHYQTVTALSRPSVFGGGGDQNQNGICSQQHRMKNMLASNLSLASSVPLNTAATSLRNQEKERKQRAGRQGTDPQLDPSSENVDNLSHQQLHALHRFRRQKKKGFLCRLRDVVISFTPKARLSIVNRPDLFVRFGLQEKEALACFDYLDKVEAIPSALEGPSDDDISPLVTIDDLLDEWKMLEEKEKAKEICSVTKVPPTSCDTTLTTPLSTSKTTCSTPAPIKEADDEGTRCTLEDCAPSLLDDDEKSAASVSVSRANSGNGKSSKKKCKQKKGKCVGKCR